ncbi:unnamed protein product, partial [Rotaria sordida]
MMFIHLKYAFSSHE